MTNSSSFSEWVETLESNMTPEELQELETARQEMKDKLRREEEDGGEGALIS